MANDLIKFGEFALGCARYELRKAGRAVKLEKIPMDLLILLALSEGGSWRAKRLKRTFGVREFL